MDKSAAPSPIMDWESNNLPSSWKRFRQHAELMFTGPLHEESELVKVSYLLIWVGEKGRDIRNTWTLTTEEAKQLETFYNKFEAYVTPKSNEVFARYKFHERTQAEGEPFENFVTDLKLLAKDCNFAENDKMIRDRIVFGLNSSQIREKLINKGSDLTLEKAISTAQSFEMSQQQLKRMEKAEVDAIKHHKNPQKSTAHKGKRCLNCGGRHGKSTCPAKGKQCFKCKRLDHFANRCKSKDVDAVDPDSDNGSDFFVEEIKGTAHSDQIFVDMEVVNVKKRIKFKLDTGSQINCIPYRYFKRLGLKVTLQETKNRLMSYSGTPLDVKGKFKTVLRYKSKSMNLEFYVVHTSASPVLGLKSCTDLGLIKLVLSVDKSDKCQFAEEFSDVFEGLGLFEGEHHICINKDYPPVIHPPRRVPHALKDKLKKELDRMEKLDVISRIDEPTDWVNSMVLVEKAKGLRVCLDPKDLNKAIKREHYRTQTLEDILPKLNGAKYFGVCDARSGYWTIKLDEASTKLTTFNTPFGRYCFKRLPFGLVSSQDVFQKKIDQAFEGIQGVEAIADDILIWGNSYEEYQRRQMDMLHRAKEKGIKLNKEKCKFGLTDVKFFGSILSKDGLKADPEKISSIVNMPRPQNKAELQTFLGMINYLSRFAPNLSTVITPLRDLTKNNSDFIWDSVSDKVFKDAKELITHSPVLEYFDSKKDITLQVDASKSGVGATLLQEGKPVAFASKALNETQQRYAQIEKECYAILFACEKFHEYIYGRQVTVQSDHKPLESIMKKPLYAAPPRLQRMLLRLQRYDLKVTYISGKEIPIADALSRKYFNKADKTDDLKDIQVHAVFSSLPVSDRKLKLIKEETEKDDQLKKLSNIISNGWPELSLRSFGQLKMNCLLLKMSFSKGIKL